MGVPIKYPRTPIKYPKTPEADILGGCGGAAAPPPKSGGAGRPPQLRLFVLPHQYRSSHVTACMHTIFLTMAHCGEGIAA